MTEESCICMADDNAKSAVDVDLCGTLKVGGGNPIIAVCTSNSQEVVGALCARDFKGVGNQYVGKGKVVCMVDCDRAVGSLCARDEKGADNIYVEMGKAVCMSDGAKYTVRRLTPMECERLQGFPDGFTKVPYKGKPAEECPDGPRYKALGNSMAVPVIEWIGRRIEAALENAAEAPETAQETGWGDCPPLPSR